MMIRHVGLACVGVLVLGTALPLSVGSAPSFAAEPPRRTPPAAPTDLLVSLTPQSEVRLSWADNSGDEDGFRIIRERQLGHSTWGEAAGFTVGPNITLFADNPAAGAYRYKLRAYNTRGNSSYTPKAEIVVSAQALAPAAPTGFSVIDDGQGRAKLIWTDNSNNESGFEIERQPTFNSSPTTVGANIAQYIDTTIGGSFSYRVRSFNGEGASSFTPWYRGRIAAPSNQPGEPSGGPNISPVFPAVVPGTGFAGPTPQPPAVGNPSAPGYDAKAIARWDVVPFQTFDSDFNVGVVAFHINGIDRVDFSCNGGPWVSVREMQLNPQTGVWEYTARLRAADFVVDGPVEVRAVAWPVVGEPRVLDSISLSNNSRGTLPSLNRYVSLTGSDTTGNGSLAQPYASIMKAVRAIQDASGVGVADGGTVYLLPGDHVYGTYSYGLYTTTDRRWLTITSAPGVNRSQVNLVSCGHTDGLRTKLVHLKNLTVKPASDIGILLAEWPMEDYLWIDSCTVIGRGRTIVGDFTGGWSGHYVTDTDISESMNGIGGLVVRNTVVHDIGQVAYSGCGLVANCSAYNIDPTGTEFHPDVYQFYGNSGNVILYGLTATSGIKAQGVFAGHSIAATDIAIVNVTIDNLITGYMRCLSFAGPTRNLLVQQSRFMGASFWATEMNFSAENVVVDSTHFSSGPWPRFIPGVIYR